MPDTPILPDDGPPSFSSEPTLVPGGVRSPGGAGGASRPGEPQTLWLDDFSVDSLPTQRPGSVSGAVGRIDQYEILRKLGGGGFGVVYLARDTVGKVDVALKTLHPLLKQNPEEMEELASQFALVSRLAHPNIASPLVLHPCRSVEIWSDEARKELRLSPGDPVMVMRYAPGVTLSKWRRQFPGRVVPLPLALEVGRQVAAALDYAHSERIVHRDVKPGNIMVETLGEGALSERAATPTARSENAPSLRVRILDFGLAAEIRSSMSRVSTETGNTSGTRPYMAPEQWLGRKQDGRTDQYALVCVLYELLSGAPPFAGVFETGDPVIMRTAVERDAPEEIESVPTPVNAALLRALAKAPKDRFPSCAAFVAALGGGAEPFTQSRGDSGGAEISFHAENAEGAERPGGASRPGEPTRGDGSHAEAAEFEPHAESAEFSGRARSPSAPQDSAALEADVLRRKVALAGALAGISAEDRVHALFGPPAKEAETELVATEEAFKWNRFAAAAACLDRAEAALARLKQVRREESERIAREKAERERKKRSHAAGALLSVTIAGVSVPLRWCPPGSFTMGSDNGDSNERPTLHVNVPDGFWMGETEVTQELWRKVMGDGIKPHNDNGDPYPMENISWNDCRDFVKKLNDRTDVKATGLRFAIPTEAQWEYACRAGTTGDYGGTGRLDEMGWYDGNSGTVTHPVQGKKPNPWGLCDMHGNVWEWCANVYRDQPDETLDNDTAVRASGGDRVLRGGSCWSGARDCRSAIRFRCCPGGRYWYFGFRLLAFQDGK